MCALRFIDSMDHYVTADIPEKWTGNSFCSIAPTSGRRGGGALTWSSNGYVTLSLDPQPTWIVGCAFRYTTLPGATTSLLQFIDASTDQCEFALTATGTIQARRSPATLLGTASAVLAVNTFYYLEFRVVIHNTLGEMGLRVNAVPVLALTGQDTQVTANATANAFRIGAIGPGIFAASLLDDVYVCDGTGAAPHNTYLGDCRVDVLLPSGDSTPLAWTPSTGTTHSTLVDESVPNDDTDYLSTLTVGARDLHVFPDLPAMINPAILGIQHCINARKDDVGTRQLKSVIKSGVTTQAGPTTLTIGSTYAYHRELWPVDPATGLAWTVAGVNAIEAGFDNLV